MNMRLPVPGKKAGIQVTPLSVLTRSAYDSAAPTPCAAPAVNHTFERVRVVQERQFKSPAERGGWGNAQTPAPAPPVSPPSPPPPGPAAPAPAASPTLSLANDSYVDAGNASHKNIRFNVTVPSGLNARDYALVNKLQGSMRKADGTYHKVQMYGSLVDFNFPSEQVDSVDADPVYWSDSSGRWNYSTTPGGFYATDDPGPPGYSFAKGDVAAVKFHIGLYRMADVPTATAGSISATPISEFPWQYSVVADTTTGALSHPSL